MGEQSKWLSLLRISLFHIKWTKMSLQEILKLPTAERLDVIEQIWDSINKEDMAIPESQKKELDRRIYLDKNNKTQ